MHSSNFKYNERHAKKINDPRTATETYWLILKKFVNNSLIPFIPPLSVGNKFVTDVLVKVSLFNNYFSQQGTKLVNNSSIPENMLSAFEFSISDISKVIRTLDLNMANGHDEISIPVRKLCASSISKPLHIICKNCLENESFLNERRKANIVPVYKKGAKQLINNYRPVPLLPNYPIVFEKNILTLFLYTHTLTVD